VGREGKHFEEEKQGGEGGESYHRKKIKTGEGESSETQLLEINIASRGGANCGRLGQEKGGACRTGEEIGGNGRGCGRIIRRKM